MVGKLEEFDYLEDALIIAYGERCEEHADGCPSCEAWKQYDVLKGNPVRKEDDNGSESQTDFRNS